MSCCESHTRSGGQRKATGPILDPSSPSPCVCAQLNAVKDARIGRSVARISTKPNVLCSLDELRLPGHERRYMSGPDCHSNPAHQSCVASPESDNGMATSCSNQFAAYVAPPRSPSIVSLRIKHRQPLSPHSLRRTLTKTTREPHQRSSRNADGSKPCSFAYCEPYQIAPTSRSACVQRISDRISTTSG